MTSDLAQPAIVLRTRPLGEADLLVVVLVRAMGKVHAAARHARKSKRRFPGGLVGGALGRARFGRGTSSLVRLDSFVPLVDHGGLGRDLRRFAYVAYLCELTDHLVLERQPDPDLFDRLWEAVRWSMLGEVGPAVLRRYELGLLARSGWLPALDHCCVCGAEVANRGFVGFDAERGGALCPSHDGASSRVQADVLAAARVLLKPVAPVVEPEHGTVAGEDDGAALRALAVAIDSGPTPTRRALRDLTFHALRPHLRRPLRSLDFFRTLPAHVRDGG